MATSLKHSADSSAKRASEPRVAPKLNAGPSNPVSATASGVWARWQWVTAGFALTAAFGWSYWPALVELAETWNREPDYSHGWLIAPVALYFLWARREQCPQPSRQFAWLGFVALFLALAVRTAGSFWFLTPLAGWSIPLWVAGACLFLCGWPITRWALPAIVFLGFMVPLPFRGETLLSYPLQAVAARLSCFSLQCLGEQAIREGNVIVLGDHRVFVAEACSGLRIFMSLVALTFGCVLLMRKPLRVKVFLLLAMLPIALATNALRIIVTAWLTTHVSGEAAHRFSHDAAGWMMMPVAVALMAAAVVYSERLVIEATSTDTREILLGVGSGRTKT